MGRFYTRHGDKLFIYVTKNDPMLDVDLFPPDLDIFHHDGARMVREKIAIGKVRDDDSFERAATVLRLNGFRENQLPSGVLFHYFAVGEESVVEGGSLFLSEGESGKARTGMPSGKGIEVIIPSSVIAGSSSMYPPIERLPEWSKGEINEGSSIEIVDSEGGQASEEDVLKNLKECMESKGFLFNYRYSPREEAPSLAIPVHMDEGRQNDEALLEHLAELTNLVKKLIRKRGNGTLDSFIESRSRLEADGWETDRELDLYQRLNPESGRINARPAREIIESIMSGLGNIEPDLE
jgi:hypothetical protein